jgi:hypothetical protein
LHTASATTHQRATTQSRSRFTISPKQADNDWKSLASDSDTQQ